MANKVIARQQFDDDTKDKYGLSFKDDPGYTQQQFKEDCSTSNILKKYIQQGINPFYIDRAQELYQDVSDVGDFQEAWQKVKNAEELFENMDAKVRHEFDGDPRKFVAFCLDKANQERIYELGLAERPPVIETKPVDQTPKEVSK